MALDVEIQYACDMPGLPSEARFKHWATAAFNAEQDTEVVVRIVAETESAELNERYRHRSGPTNVLSFPFEAPLPVRSPLLGDLVVCAPVIAREAREQSKLEPAHWAHVIVHGMLHLQGYDHETERQAREMETLEIDIMMRLGYANPYA